MSLNILSSLQCRAPSLTTLALLAVSLSAQAATWERMPKQPPLPAGTMMLMTDGTVMVHSWSLNARRWMILEPNDKGQYTGSSWKILPPMGLSRKYFQSKVLPNGKLWVIGGYYVGNDVTLTPSAEVFDPATGKWLPAASHPEATFSAPTKLLDDGTIMTGSHLSRSSYFYNYTTDTWSGPVANVHPGINTSESWARLPDGRVLGYAIDPSVSQSGSYAEVFDPTTKSWSSISPSDGTALGSIPLLTGPSVGYSMGGTLNLQTAGKAGAALVLGASGHTAVYDVASNTWSAGPDIEDDLNGERVRFGAADAAAVEMPNGHVLFLADASPTLGSYVGPTRVFDFDPVTRTIQPAAPAFPVTMTNAAYGKRLLMLPTGQVLFQMNAEMWIYTPDGKAPSDLRPKPRALRYDGNGVFTLAGLRLNGNSSGSSQGSLQSDGDENYPLVSLRADNGQVRYARTSTWNPTGIPLDRKTTVRFTLKPGTPAGSHALTVSGAGVASDARCITLTAEQAAGTGAAADIPFEDCPPAR